MLKRAGVANSNIVNIYKCSVNSILEYATAAWQDIPEYLSSKLESIQRISLKVVFPGVSYKKALAISGLPSLEVRRETLSRKFIATQVHRGGPWTRGPCFVYIQLVETLVPLNVSQY